MSGWRCAVLHRGLQVILGLVASCPALAQADAAAGVERLRIVGGLAGVSQFTQHEEPFWTRQLPQLTGGKAVAEIVPFDRAGLTGEELLSVVKMGAVPFASVLLSRSAAVEPELAAVDLAGLNPDVASLKRNLAAYRPRLAALLQERYGIELLAVYVYPAQVIFCAKPMAGLADLKGRRVRVSSSSQADFMTALGAEPVQTAFSQIVASVRAGSVDCAVTGTMSGHTIGLHEVTTHIHPMAVNWGVAAFVANGARWAALSPALRTTLQRELPRLEQRIWADAERETSEGLACNTGGAACREPREGRKGRMHLVAATRADEQRRQEILQGQVLPAWLLRCGPGCQTQWQQTIGRTASVVVR
jgi:TRAP-type C4-dicarboxylate transport system substrate-binding protein